MLPQIPNLKHIIYVENKTVSTAGYPEGIQLHSMEAVQKLGAKPEHRKCSLHVTKLDLYKREKERQYQTSIRYLVDYGTSIRHLW